MTTRRSFFTAIASAFVGIKARALSAFRPISAAAPSPLDQLNALTLQHIVPRTNDVIYKQSPLLVYLEKGTVFNCDGGKCIPISFTYHKQD